MELLLSQAVVHEKNISGQIYLAIVLSCKHFYTSLGGVYDMDIPLERKPA